MSTSRPTAFLLGLMLAACAGTAAAQSPPDPATALGTAAASAEPPTAPTEAALLDAEQAVIDDRFRVDPWEPFNRRMHRFNKVVDRTVAEPLAHAYVAVVPQPVRTGVRNFFTNLFQPLTALHLLLQGHPADAGIAAGRFLINATLGIGGLFDPASAMDLPLYDEDLGQTLAVWGWDRSRYLELPFLGPRTVRDAFGSAGDGTLSPYRFVDDDQARYALIGLSLVDLRTQLFAVDELTQGVEDDYIIVRDGWLQRRNYMIRDRSSSVPGRVIQHIPGLRDHVHPRQQAEPSLPDYLDEPLPGEEGYDGAPLPAEEPAPGGDQPFP
ncbi:MlaA family lipoprotein [Coralloluteibacterium stylophorae]|uniref:VacJ family lipoprotein n=1 Tax=Coralloluteibacterium stylophorae TaxID=1776034 RepID=A0A8J7VQZ8_9GAMM|nr:VacJ family lipoprotein [Coralloluteibacterium stylophorae]MBS7458157.1 VacJ family lipoprotein [Coralloluteibacterium stylophorae]